MHLWPVLIRWSRTEYWLVFQDFLEYFFISLERRGVFLETKIEPNCMTFAYLNIGDIQKEQWKKRYRK